MAGVRWSVVLCFCATNNACNLYLLCYNNSTINDRHGGEHE